MNLNFKAINMVPNEVKLKIESTANLLRGKKVLVLLSGGVDSSLVLILSHIYAKETIAITSTSIIYNEEVIERAKKLAKSLGIRHIIIDRNPFIITDLIRNDDMRCYYCKKDLLTKVKLEATKLNVDIIVDGTNKDDLNDLRPGIRALRELGIRSPLAEANITKREVRLIAKKIGLKWYNAPPESCYIMRIKKGIKLTRDLIEKVKKAEKLILKHLNVKLVRLRHYGEIAIIELLPEDFYNLDLRKLPEITRKLKELGYSRVTLDLAGYHNSLINENQNL